jgi:cobalamin biosynthesis protein CbiD
MLLIPAAVKYSNWEETYRTLCSAMKQQQPDVIFGFSQGATAAALFLAALQTAQRQGRDVDVPLPKGCVVVSTN